jgi:hypothetical protein
MGLKAQDLLGDKRAARIQHCFAFMEWDVISDRQEHLLISYEEQFERLGDLTDRQCEVLESIFEEAAEKA